MDKNDFSLVVKKGWRDKERWTFKECSTKENIYSYPDKKKNEKDNEKENVSISMFIEIYIWHYTLFSHLSWKKKEMKGMEISRTGKG